MPALFCQEIAGWLVSEEELRAPGLRFGKNVRIDRTAIFHGADRITLGSNVRIDAYTIITAEQPIQIGSFIHLGAA